MSSSRSSSTGSFSSWLGDWDQPWNVVDTLGLPKVYNLSKEDRKLMSKFSFDDHKEFSDIKIFKMQSTHRFYNLKSLIKFPCQPFFSSIFSVFSSRTDSYRLERFIQRRICLKSCNWNPRVCFLEDSHSGNLKDLMKQEFHNLYNPDFQSKFDKEKTTCKLICEGGFYPPNMNSLIEELGVSSTLDYENGNALNFDYLTKEFRNLDRPLFTFEEKKCHDVLEALLEVTKDNLEKNRNQMKNLYWESFDSSGALTKPILSLMMWGPQPNNLFPTSSQICRLERDPDNRLVLEEKLHHCSNFLEKDYWMFSHGNDVSCQESKLGHMSGPAMTDELTVIYPCSKGLCSLDCTCDLCDATRRKLCPLKSHKKHLIKFEKSCPVQKDSQCQDHWVDHPENFNDDEDIRVEKNLYYHNKELVNQPRSYAVEIIKFAGIKKSCITCRKKVQNHFEKHMEYHLQCKFCLFQFVSMEDPSFWKRVCNFCGKVMSSSSQKRMNWHKKVHAGVEEFTCSLCGLELKRKNTLQRHMKEVHNEEWPEDSVVSRILNNFDDSGLDNIQEIASAGSLSSKPEYPTHLKHEKEKFQCDECGKGFRLERYLEMHTKYSHANHHLLKCSECGNEYKHKGHLKRHKIRIHKLNEDKHINIGDETSETFSCNTCKKEFGRKDLLTKHLTTHQLKEKHSCIQCGKAYGRKDNLKEHIKLQHVNPEVCYSCNLCGEKFKRKFNLRRHTLTLHI